MERAIGVGVAQRRCEAIEGDLRARVCPQVERLARLSSAQQGSGRRCDQHGFCKWQLGASSPPEMGFLSLSPASIARPLDHLNCVLVRRLPRAALSLLVLSCGIADGGPRISPCLPMSLWLARLHTFKNVPVHGDRGKGRPVGDTKDSFFLQLCRRFMFDRWWDAEMLVTREV